jgi:glycosyltransferase involved in cell wall biosynthesis
VIEHFLSPEELGELFSETVLNIHPPTHDAFGMTIVESAAFGAPSVVHNSGAVGASELIETIGVDVEAPTRDFADKIEEILVAASTRVIAKNASARALEWDEASFGKVVFEHLSSHIRKQ